MNRKKRILILTLSFGAGHVRAAESVRAELCKQLPEVDLLMVDALKNCSLTFRAFYVWSYWSIIRYAPSLWNWFFNARKNRRDEQTAPGWLWRIGCKKVFEKLQTFRPDIIVACEVGACEIAVIARRENLTRAKIINVITDFEAEPIWVKPEISSFSVPSKEVAKQLQEWGAHADQIKICGIPINESFSKRHDAEKVKQQFGLDPRHIVLLMGGGMGPTRMDIVVARLLEKGENLNIVALTGKDERMRQELKKLRDSKTVSLRAAGWTDQVPALMQAATILVTKPGGVTLSEAAACGLPMVFFDAIPGPELSNAVHFVAAGAAVQTCGSEETVNEVLRLINDQNVLFEMAIRCRKLAQPNSAKEIVKQIMVALRNPENFEKCLSVEPNTTESVWGNFNLQKQNVVEVEVK